MRKDLTDIVLIIDCSGSMHSCREVASNAINTFLEDQAKLPGEVLVTLVDFDSKQYTRALRQPITSMSKYRLQAGGNTALLDAVGHTVTREGKLLAELSEDDRPGLVIVAIVTDGQENVSQTFSKYQIKEMIRVQKEVYSWQFTYLGADQDAFAEAATLGITRDSTLNFDKSKAVYTQALSANVGRMRSAVRAGGQACSSYTDEESASAK